MSREFNIEEHGFITKWLVSEPVIQPFSVKRNIDDQLMFEKHMRECVADRSVLTQQELELLWVSPMNYLQNQKNWFVDFSEFYHLTKKIELNTKTVLIAKQDMTLKAVLWTYAAVQIYVNNQCICKNDVPVYKPIVMHKFTLKLKQGENQILVHMQNLGVRDTRNILGIQLLEGKEQVYMSIPQVEGVEQIIEAERYLNTITYGKGNACFKTPSDFDIQIKELDCTIKAGFVGGFSIEKKRRITFCIKVGEQEITRTIEAGDQIKPVYVEEHSLESENRKYFFEYISGIDPSINHEAEKFSIYLLLARYAVGKRQEQDEQILLQQLDLLNTRIDCADFIVNGFIRFMNCYELEEKVNIRAKEVLLNFRYWMDEDGEDGMCFWSENHSLLFYSALLLVAKKYPEDIFLRSSRTGKEQYVLAKKKVHGWLNDVLEHGFEEFLSGGYTVVTVAALLNLVDFAGEEISSKAKKTIDIILVALAKHTFKGSVIAPEGRIYRDVIYPFEQGIQGLIHYIHPEYPICDNIWLASFATTRYTMPQHLVELMKNDCFETHETGNALIILNKKKDFVLTSVASPREDNFTPWYNNSFDQNVDRNDVRYTKSINERFHGTTFFQPGVYGYQQHLWYAALDNECVVFTNHPGENTDRSSMRPAYWYGNGIIPAIKQAGNYLGIVYQIPEHHPIHFTHLYFPEDKFDRVKKQERWIFGQKDEGYLAVWSNCVMEAYDDLLINCEYRSYGSQSAYACLCGSASENGSFDEFIALCNQLKIYFDEENLQLNVEDKLEVKFVVNHNKTQYI